MLYTNRWVQENQKLIKLAAEIFKNHLITTFDIVTSKLSLQKNLGDLHKYMNP